MKSDEEKLNIPTTFEYIVKPSAHSKRYFYLVEIETDGFGTTSRAITRALTKNELLKLGNDIIHMALNGQVSKLVEGSGL